MMIDLEYLHIIFAIETDEGTENVSGDGLSILPGVGDVVEMDYVHGTKITFVVTSLKHHLSSIGEKVLQQIEVSGKKIHHA